jgi:hypothetical protein
MPDLMWNLVYEAMKGAICVYTEGVATKFVAC